MNNYRLALVYKDVEFCLEEAKTGETYGAILAYDHCTAKIGRGDGPSSMPSSPSDVAFFFTGIGG